jgi:hypothetical protein
LLAWGLGPSFPCPWVGPRSQAGKKQGHEMRDRDGYTKIESVVIRSTGLSTLDLKVYALLKSHRNEKMGACFPSVGLLAEEARLSDREISRAKNHLKDVGLIAWKRHGQKSAEYSFPLIDGSPEEKKKLIERHLPRYRKALTIETTQPDKFVRLDSSQPDILVRPNQTKHCKTYHYSNKTNELPTAQPPPLRGEGGAAVGANRQERKKEKPIEEKERLRLEREAKREANRPEHERILAEYRARKRKE